MQQILFPHLVKIDHKHSNRISPLHAELNPIYHLLALLGARHVFHFSRIRVKRLAKGYCRIIIQSNVLYCMVVQAQQHGSTVAQQHGSTVAQQHSRSVPITKPTRIQKYTSAQKHNNNNNNNNNSVLPKDHWLKSPAGFTGFRNPKSRPSQTGNVLTFCFLRATYSAPRHNTETVICKQLREAQGKKTIRFNFVFPCIIV